jgi:hypothetical protein
MSRPTKSERELQLLAQEGIVDKSGIRIGTDAVKLNRKPAALAETRQLFNDYEELHGLKGPSNVELAEDRTNLKSVGASSNFKSAVNEYGSAKKMKNHWLITKDEMVHGYLGNYDTRYKEKAIEQDNSYMLMPFGGSRVARAATRFVPSAAMKFIGSLGHAGGAVYDGITGLFGNNSNLTYDNWTSQFAKWAEKGIENYLHIYESEDYKNAKGFKLGHIETWTQDIADGLEYVGSNVVGGFALKGVSAGSKALRAGTGLARAADAGADVAQGAAGFKQFMGNLGFATAMTMGEAGVEGAEVYAKIKESLRNKVNPDTGVAYTEKEIQEKAELGADATWRGNMLMLMPSNMFMAHVLFRPNAVINKAQKAVKRMANDMLTGKGVNKSAIAKGVKAGLGNSALGVLSEGLWEENFQLSISRASERLALKGDDKWWSNVFQGGVDQARHYLKGLGGGHLTAHEQEGAMSIMIGGIIGKLMGAKEGYSAYKKQKGIQNMATSLVNAMKGEAGIAQGMFTDNFGSIFIGSKDEEGKFQPEMDDNGNLQVDWNAAKQLFYRRLYDEKLAEETALGMARGDAFHIQATRDLAFARMVHGLAMIEDDSKVSNKRPGNEGVAKALFEDQLQNMIKSFEGATDLDAKRLRENFKSFYDAWKRIDSGVKIKDVVDGITTKEFEDTYKKVHFYNQVKLHSYREFLREALDKKDQKAADEIQSIITDTETYLTDLENNKKAAAKRWAEELNAPKTKRREIMKIDNAIKNNKNLSANERKDLENEREQLMYELQEARDIHGTADEGYNFVRNTDSHNTTELSIAEHEAYELKGQLGMKHAHFFQLGHAVLGNNRVGEIEKDIEDKLKLYEDDNTTPEEKEKLMTEIQAARRDLVNTIRNNANNSTPGMKEKLEAIEDATQESIVDLETEVKDIQSAIHKIGSEINKVRSALNALIGKAKVYQSEAVDALFNLHSIVGFDGLPDTPNEIQDKLDSLNDADKESFIGHIAAQIDDLINSDPEFENDIKDLLEGLAPTLSADTTGLSPSDIFKLGLRGIAITPEVAQLQAKHSALEQQSQDLKKELDQAMTNLSTAKNFMENVIKPAVQDVESGQSNSKEILANKDNDNYWRRKVANKPINRTNALYNNAMANPEAFSDSHSIIDIKGQLQTLKRIFTARKMEDGTLMKDSPEFKGYMDSIEEALKKLDELQKIANENEGKRGAKQQAVLEAQAIEDVNLLGLNVDDSGSIVTTRPKIWDIIKSVVGETKANEIFNSATNKFEQGVAARIVLQLFMDQAGNKVAALLNELNAENAYISKDLEAKAWRKDLFLDAATLEGSYYSNPARNFDTALLNDIMNKSKEEYKDDPQSDPFFKYEETRDINELTHNVESSKLPDSYKQAYKELLEIHKTMVSNARLRDLVESDYNYAEQFLSEDEILSEISSRPDKIEQKHVPTGEQLIAIRQIIQNIKRAKSSNAKIKGIGELMSYLRGIPGTGKTKMVLKWVTDIAGIEPSKIYSFSHNSKSSKAIAESTGTGVGSIEDFLAQDLDGVEMIVIDEIGFLNNKQSEDIQKKIKKLNSKRKSAKEPLITIVGLGDPSQITQSVSPLIESSSYMPGLRVVNPLTQSYRSNVPSIANLFKIFQRNPRNVTNVTTSANTPVHTVWDPNNEAVGVHSGAATSDLLHQVEMFKDSGRSKVIIVNTEADKARYKNGITDALVNKGELEILTYDQAQGQTFDEVYVDLDPTGNNLRGKAFSANENNLQFNQAMYTAISRAKSYVFVVEPSFKNAVDSNLIDNKTKAEQEVAEAFVNYTNRHEREKEMLSEHLLTEEQQNQLNTITVNTQPPAGGTNNPTPSNPSPSVPTDIKSETQEPEGSRDVETPEDLEEDLSDPESLDPQSTKNVEPVGTTTNMKGDNTVIDENGNEVLEISNPEYINLKRPEGDGIVPENAPVILVKVKKKGKVQTVYLGQVQRNGEWQQEWMELGVMSTEDRNNKLYNEKVKENEDDFNNNGGTPALYNGVELKAVSKAISYGADNKATVDMNKATNIMSVSTLKASQVLSYRYGDNYQQKGAVGKLLSMFNKVFGKARVTNPRVQIFSEGDLSAMKTSGNLASGRFVPKLGCTLLSGGC